MKYGVIAKKKKFHILVDVYNENFIKIAHGRCIDQKSIVLCAAYAILENRELTLNTKYCGVTEYTSESILFWKRNFSDYEECIIRIMDDIKVEE